MDYILVPAVFAKSEISEIGALKGKVNGDSITLGGVKYKAHTLRFVRFCGRHVGEQRYEGMLNFETWDEAAEAEMADFSILTKEPVKKKKAFVKRSVKVESKETIPGEKEEGK